MPVFLHVGCGSKHKDRTTRAFAAAQWEERRFDIDPAAKPDIVGTMTDLHAVADGSMDALFSSHNIEHLYPHEVPVALAEFRRVLAPQGFAVITCPDLQAVAQRIAQGLLEEPAYQSPAGPISALDMVYGHRPALARGNLYMAHRTGFTRDSLLAALRAAGFASAIGRRQPEAFALWAIATCEQLPEARLRALAAAHFP